MLVFPVVLYRMLRGHPPLQLNAMLGTHTQVLEILQKQSPGNFR